ncbi:MAG: hypothetical protein CL755_09720 [Chloroflexi bacterium]|jgi:uncharacterized protein (DUF1800 family)|nr:hypothetical protein [Chloroflexota bacterium]MEE2928472.1 DUF1800 domain-containing protein [Chloroflexota bacterium]HIM47469.1 DUF1800 domain-containing protein [Dehalococcoidia bacterium]|tara:strand:- start:5717 stop:7141 length:1425 start_codon:yes stop_codon:yes gene_type:complete
MADENIALMAHLLRRSGFGASRDEIEAKAALGYQQTLDDLLAPESQENIEEDLLFRYNPSYWQSAAIENNVQAWLYTMINTPRQLQEKMALFWHMIFCAGHSKIDSGYEMGVMISMFREHGMGNFRDLIYRLSTSPGMMYYLDNTESHQTALNENYGRELLELFSLGAGKDEELNYSEDDVKACARAFTGWNNAPAYPPFPYGRSPWEFRFDPADHDGGEKTFLGETGAWNGDDILDIICKQPATARFLARHLYNYFVADDVQIPAWRLTPPQDLDLIQAMEKTYFDSGYDITEMLRVLFNSEKFKSESVRFAKVKSPAEVVAGTLRMVEEHREIKLGLFQHSQEPKYMGMDLMNPPTVEGWHTGREWIDSGTLVERINYASELLGNTELPGVKGLINRLMSRGDSLSPETFVDGCLDLIGPITVDDGTRSELVAHAQKSGDLRHSSSSEQSDFTRRTGEMFQMIASTAEFQFE